MSDQSKESNRKDKRPLGRGLGSLLGSQLSDLNSQPPMNTQRVGVSTQSKTETAKVTTQNDQASLSHQTLQSFGQNTASNNEENRVYQLAVSKLVPGVYQPRQSFERESLTELAASIKEKGILQPITVRKVGERFEIVAGERRWRAAQIAGLHEVPVLLRRFQDQEALEYAIIENVQREDLDPIEEADAYARLGRDFKLSQAEIAQKVGRERATVANSLRLLALPMDVKDLVRQSQISVGHAKVLLSLGEATKMSSLAKKIAHEKMSVRKLEALVSQLNTHLDSQADRQMDRQSGQLSTQTTQTPESRALKTVQEELQKLFGTKIQIEEKAGAGKLSIHYYDREQFNSLVERLREAQAPKENSGQRGNK